MRTSAFSLMNVFDDTVVDSLHPGGANANPGALDERTRGFYDRMGFEPLEENELWGAENPCLIMVKQLSYAEPNARGS